MKIPNIFSGQRKNIQIIAVEEIQNPPELKGDGGKAMSVVEERAAKNVFDALREITEDDFVRAFRAKSNTTKSKRLEIIEQLVERVFTSEDIAAAFSSRGKNSQLNKVELKIERQK